MKGYDGYFLLEYFIDQSIRPQKVIYSGSKIMYMEVDNDLQMKVLDILNFIAMKLSPLPKTFEVTELKKAGFHICSTPGRTNSTWERIQIPLL